MTEAERQEALERVAADVRTCTRCRLHEGRTQAVPGEGHGSTEVLFVGEGPGLNEDRQGRPFVGAAGQVLNELLGSVGWSRDEVFITNIVKCRPPGNRDPESDEVEACAPYLRRQMEILDPALVVTLGRHSLGRFMPGARISQAHGTVRPVPPDVAPGGVRVFAMYHPAAALHQGSLRQTLLDDMASVPAALVEARRARLSQAPAPASGPDETPEPDPVAGAGSVAIPAPLVAAGPGPAVEAAPVPVAAAVAVLEPLPGSATDRRPATDPPVGLAAVVPGEPAPDDDQMTMF